MSISALILSFLALVIAFAAYGKASQPNNINVNLGGMDFEPLSDNEDDPSDEVFRSTSLH